MTRILCLYCAPMQERYGVAIDDFFHSYDNHEAGLEHDLLVIYKSLDYATHCAWPETRLKSATGSQREWPRHLWVIHYNMGFDIGSYLYCIQEDSRWRDYDYYVCISTTSILYADQWLTKLIKPFTSSSSGGHRVGVVGACGSWQHTVHIRTDFFAVPRDFFIGCQFPSVQDKDGGYAFEKALTKTAHDQHHQCLVVNQHGDTFAPWEWKQPGMFAHADYWRNIISADHRTRGLYLNPLNQHWVWTDSSAEEFRHHPAYV